MSNTVKYLNEFGEEISIDRASSLGSYYIEKYIDNKQSTRDKYVDGIFKMTFHFIDSHDQISDVLRKDSSAGFSIKTVVGAYLVTETLLYNSNTLKHKSINVIEIGSDNIICHQSFDEITDKPVHTATEKSYYENDLEIYLFTYNEDGSCFEIQKGQESYEGFYASDMGVDPTIHFSWSGFEYYQYGDPFLPA